MTYFSAFLYNYIQVRFKPDIGPEDLGSIPGRVIPKTQKMVLDASLLNTEHYKVRIKGKVVQSRERSFALPLHLGVVAIEKGAFGSPSTMVTNFTLLTSKLVVLKIWNCIPCSGDKTPTKKEVLSVTPKSI